MKNKLKLFLRYFKSFKAESVNTYMIIDNYNIDEWDGEFKISLEKSIEPLESIQKIMTDVVYQYMDEIYKVMEDEMADTYFNIEIKIKPFEEKIYITPEIKVNIKTFHDETLQINDIPQLKENLEKIKNFYPDTYRYDFQFEGSWGDGEVNNLSTDGIPDTINADADTYFWDIAYQTTKKFAGGYWNEGPGCKGNIEIWEDDVFFNAVEISEDWVLQEKSVIINPNTFPE